MFSLYDNNIYLTKPIREINIKELVDIIKNNRLGVDYFNLVRKYKKGSDEYKKGKTKLHRINPNCLLRKNKVEGKLFKENYIRGSGYIYLDIDDLDNVHSYKESLINDYGDIITLCCISSGGRGISLLIKINVDVISKLHFSDITNFIKTTYFSGIEFDNKTDKLTTLLFLSHDPDIYYNENNFVDVSHIEKCVDKGIIYLDKKDTLFYAKEKDIMSLSINLINSMIITKTEYKNNNDIDINPIEWTDIKHSNIIKDNFKRKTYTRLIHGLIHLNPNEDLKWSFAYLYNVNRHCADPKMSYRDLISLFNFQLKYIKSEGYVYKNSKIKRLHINPKLELSGSQKSIISNKVNGALRSNESKRKIIESLNKLKENNEKVTATSIHKLSGVSRKTVGLHLKDLKLNDIDKLIRSLLDKE